MEMNSNSNSTQHCSDSEEEEINENQDWDDFEADEEDANSQLLCLFCDSSYTSCSLLFKHCASIHGFHFQKTKKALKLDFYSCFKLINYVRSQVASNICWSCGKICSSDEQLRNHLHETATFENDILPWDDDKYLNPFLSDDALLYSFDEEEEDDVADSIDSEELMMYLSQIPKIETDEEDPSGKYASDLGSHSGKGEKEINLAADRSTTTANALQKLQLNGGGNPSDVSDAPMAFNNSNNKRCTTTTNLAADEIKNKNRNYFGGYSSFGIHRDMISDKVRTDAYRQAIVENPSLLGGAVVMDVGCGTGILSLFAAQAGASRVFAVEASEKMAAVATQIAKNNGLLWDRVSGEGSEINGVIDVVQGMIEMLGNADHIQPQSIDVLVSEWMGYCLLYESMLSSVLYARDRWLKPGGAILPDTATMFVAGFGRGGTSTPFWENVYGFDMTCIGQEVAEHAAGTPIVDVIENWNIVTTTALLQSFDLATMQPKQMDFTSEIELETRPDAPKTDPSGSKLDTNWCYGVVIWFDTGFTERFCKDKPVNLSTSPYGRSTHWSQTILTFREPIAISSNPDGNNKLGLVGTDNCPAKKLHSRISIVRAAQHRCIDISLEVTGIGDDGRKRNWPAQIFNLN